MLQVDVLVNPITHSRILLGRGVPQTQANMHLLLRGHPTPTAENA